MEKMKTIFEVSYFNQIWGYVCIIMVALVFIVIFAKPITSFFVNLRSEVLCILNKQDKSDDFKNGYLFLCRMIPLAVIIALVGGYISHLIPVLQYRFNDQYEHTTGIVEKDRDASLCVFLRKRRIVLSGIDFWQIINYNYDVQLFTIIMIGGVYL